MIHCQNATKKALGLGASSIQTPLNTTPIPPPNNKIRRKASKTIDLNISSLRSEYDDLKKDQTPKYQIIKFSQTKFINIVPSDIITFHVVENCFKKIDILHFNHLPLATKQQNTSN